ncbi:TPA: flagellar hook-associated protein FlgK [Escherichia coli]|nr:flagellar hook-associated protein FlgK [Escherichia coli]HCO6176820.1 flagellar hook-associated protein FlgK [Escherichia coli]HCO7122518.1 flagellar hook-associated protein FlgK [Escherichia coli]HCO7123981.1 flagellar hook-associated protein FlgK [Escherichia coli]HCP7329290.1 flagellar hook-associated protein FlgK [Escherichia coli]
MDMINIGYSGASTAQVELNVTAQNTANAMTTGYTRQVAEISTIGASGGSPNSAGNGVQVDSIRRVSNQYQVNQVWYAASDYGYYSTQQGYLTQLEAVLSDDNSSLSGGFDNFFAALNEATTSPDDSALREQVISEAGALSLRIDNTLDYIDSQSTEIISQQQAMVSQINTLTSGIASYNQQIAQAEANGDNASALYDARDQMVEELSGMMDVQVNIDDQGNYNVTLKNGQPLVSGQQSSTIALETNADGPLTVNPDITADELAFSSSPDESGNSDNLQALINISTEPLEIANLGSVTVGQACSSIISNIGIYSQQNQTEVDAASNVYSEAQNQQSSVSGVSMDEEAVNLITYQQIYEANLKVISAGAEIFDSVLEMCS